VISIVLLHGNMFKKMLLTIEKQGLLPPLRDAIHNLTLSIVLWERLYKNFNRKNLFNRLRVQIFYASKCEGLKRIVWIGNIILDF